MLKHAAAKLTKSNFNKIRKIELVTSARKTISITVTNYDCNCCNFIKNVLIC